MLRFFLLLLVLLSVSTVAASSEDEFPGSAAERAFTLWLSAHNDGGREALQAFNDKYHVKADVQNDLDFRESVGQLRLLEIRTNTPTKVEALLLSEWDRATLATITVEPKDPLKLDLMQFESVPTPETFQPKRMAIERLVGETKSRLDAFEAADKVSGSFLVAKDGKPVFEWTGGRADRETGVSVSRETRFRMASLGKMLTAVAILQLAEAGHVSLDQPLSTYLRDYPNHQVAKAITLRQLLNHTSGTGDVFGEDFEKVSRELKTHTDYWRLYAAKPLEFEPGAQDRYSNYGYLLLGSVIEAVSGQSYYDYVEQHICRPAGMTATGFEPESTPVAHRANAYTRVDGRWSRETASLPWRGTAAGGGYTTTSDLLKFATALENQTLLSRKSLEAATAPQNHKAWYGYGFMLGGEGVDRQYGHEGGGPGSNAAFQVIPERGIVVIGLSNFDPSTMANMVNFVVRRVP